MKLDKVKLIAKNIKGQYETKTVHLDVHSALTSLRIHYTSYERVSTLMTSKQVYDSLSGAIRNDPTNYTYLFDNNYWEVL